MLTQKKHLLQALSKLEECCSEINQKNRIFRDKKVQFDSLREIVIDESVWMAFFLPDNFEELLREKKNCVQCVGQASFNLKKKALEILDDEKKMNEISGILDPLSKNSQVVTLMFVELIYLLKKNIILKEEIEKKHLLWLATANHFGLWNLRYVLEDLFFYRLNRKKYDLIKSLLKTEEKNYKSLFNDIHRIIKHFIDKEKIKNVEILFRKKNVHSIYRKMKIKGKTINHVTDFFGFRIIVDTVEDCYKIRDILSYLWPHYGNRYKDYIAHPKDNQYQSIHTTLNCLNNHVVEFQIRTRKMDYIAKYGPASHMIYKNKQDCN